VIGLDDDGFDATCAMLEIIVIGVAEEPLSPACDRTMAAR
jgi:hypothetical protein